MYHITIVSCAAARPRAQNSTRRRGGVPSSTSTRFRKRRGQVKMLICRMVVTRRCIVGSPLATWTYFLLQLILRGDEKHIGISVRKNSYDCLLAHICNSGHDIRGENAIAESYRYLTIAYVCRHMTIDVAYYTAKSHIIVFVIISVRDVESKVEVM